MSDRDIFNDGHGFRPFQQPRAPMKIHKTQLNAAIRDIPLPANMLERPVSKQGYPVPFFVGKVDGEWDFRVANQEAFYFCIKKSLCWVCGQQMGQLKSFVTGPMCVATRTTAEPACHLSCARYAAIACPFLAQPKMKRNEKDMPDNHEPAAGHTIMRNPGVAAVLVTRSFQLFNAPGGVLISMGEPERVEWYAQRRPATRAEVQASIDSGVPLLRAADAGDAGVQAAITEGLATLDRWLPK